MELTVDAKLDSKYPAIEAGGKKYSVTPELFSQIKVGQTYSVITKDRQVTSKKDGKTYTFQDVVAISEPHTNGKEAAIEKLSGAKNDNIARCSALSNAALLTKATAEIGVSTGAFGSMNRDQIKDWVISVNKTILKENAAFLGIDMGVPF